MRTKIQTINAKLVILEIIILFAGLFIAIFTYTSINKIKQNFELLNNVNSLKINLTHQDQAIYNLIETDQFNISFYKKEKTISLTSFYNYQKLDSSIIIKLINNNDLKNSSTLYDKCLKVKENIKEYNYNFDILILNLRDRGFQNYGNMGNVLQMNNQILQTLGTVNDFSLNELLDKLNKKIVSFSNSIDVEIANQVSSLTQQVINKVYELSEEYPLLDLNQLNTQFELLQNLINIVIEKNNNIGIKNDIGITKKLKNISNGINTNLLEISKQLYKDIPVENIRITNSVLIIVLIITFLIAIYLIYLIRCFVSPVISVKEYLLKIAQGALPNKLFLKTKDEFNQIIDTLDDIIVGLKAKTNFATELGNGNLNTEYKSISDKDTLGNALLTLQKSLQKAAEEDKNHRIENERRRWSNEGLAKFSEILRINNDNTEMLCDSVIKNLVKYLDASLGGIYLYNDEDKNNVHLYLASTFAYDRKKFYKTKILLGEGLIGACAQEKQTIYMTKIPDEYILITSGLGKANPNVLLIVPLNLENEVLGVLEIASFNVFETHVLEFVEKLAESIASTLASAKINERTQQLLEQSQKQAVEMAEQEEEMRQNMEELQSTQDESSRRESEMYGILHAINTTSYFFETDLDGTITEMNGRMLNLLEIQREHVIGMHHSELTAMNKNSPEYISFWNELKEGDSVTKIQKYESINKNEIWLKQNYTPIYNKEEKVTKIICISNDISETVQLEKNIQKSERELSTKNNELSYLNSAIDVSYLKCEIDGNGKILEVNNNFEKNIGYAKKELLEKMITDLLAPDQKKSFDRIWENIINGHPFSNIIKFLSSAKELKYIKTTFKPIVNEKGECHKIILLGELYSSNIDNE